MLAHAAAGALLVALQEPSVAFSFADPRIAESSGLVVSSSGELVYTHNDSGDEARVFAVGLDGRTRTTWTLPGVQTRDWEDVARGPDEQGRSCLWLGDIGDNSASRDRGLLVHRVLEPEPTDREQADTEAPTSFRLRYPGPPRDAETLLVHPRTGRLHLVTKPLAGVAEVYAAPEVLDPDGPNALELVGRAPTRSTGTPGGPAIGPAANLLVTAGDVAPDGRRVALRTYTDVYEWTVPGDDLGAAFDGEPTVTPLPPTPQGEALGYAVDGASVLVSTEGQGTPVHRVVLRTAEPPAEDAPAQTAPEQDAPEPSAPDQTVDQDEPPPSRTPLLAGVAAVAAVAALLLHRRRRRG